MALRLGLRFEQREAEKLTTLAAQHRSIGATDGLFDRAADSARDGEPLIVICENRDEIEQMAHGFIHWGITRPVIEELNG